MIERLHIRNFRCLRDVALELEPLTVFVGANASGKSSVFAALQPNYTPDDLWQRDVSLRIDVRAERGQQQAQRYTYAGARQTETTEGFPDVMPLQLDLTQLRMTNELHEMKRLNANGAGLSNVFATLTRQQQDAVAKQYCELVPMFADVFTRPRQNGHHRILFADRWRAEVTYEPSQVSDGSILLLTYLLLPFQSPTPDIITIEEPERGLHPFLMQQLILALRRLATGDLGPRAIQVLLATHSAELLEFVAPREVRFFRRCKQTGETIVEAAPVDDPSWPASLREYDNSLGDLWLSGGLGGVPGS